MRKRGAVYRFEGTANVRGETVAETEFMAAFVEWEGRE
jgi:hypothetical protein